MIIKSSIDRFRIKQGTVFRLRLDAHQILHCQSGKLWVTRNGDAKDYWLLSGQTLHFSGASEVMIEADENSMCCVRKKPVIVCKMQHRTRSLSLLNPLFVHVQHSVFS